MLQGKVNFLVNLKSCHARVLKWAIRENIRPVELAQYWIFCIGPARLGIYFLYCPVEDSGRAALRIHQRVRC